MKTSLAEIGRFDDRLSFLYVDRAIIRHSGNAIAIHEVDPGTESPGVTEVPLSAVATLMLGPGTRISHKAIQLLAESNCLVIWCGEFGVRFYACGMGGSRHSRNMLKQAKLALDERSRLQVVVNMYLHRFTGEPIDPTITLQQLRGKEGVRVRQAYADASQKWNVPWAGRNYDRQSWNAGDAVNRALSSANACLYGVVHAAILSAGYSPAIGFVHCGKQLSFVYDIADLYKAELTIPLAFEAVAGGTIELERRVRLACRTHFHKARLMGRVLPDITRLLSVKLDDIDEFVDDPARPVEWWEPKTFTADTPIQTILSFKPPE
jgi:CRISPR-associated protein Cas1